MSIEVENFGDTPDGQSVYRYTLRNEQGITAKIINYGAAITELHAPDKHGQFTNITLGFDSLHEYLTKNDPFFGVVAGRYANRIAKGHFQLNGQAYNLAINNGPNHLHGGNAGFDKRVWASEPAATPNGTSVILRYESPHNEENYPGNLRVELSYELTNDNELVLRYTATADQATPINLTNHAYWHLGGEGTGTIHDHRLTIHAEQYTPTDDSLIPTGDIVPVANTPFDFRSEKRVGDRIHEVGIQPNTGYDMNFVLKEAPSETPRLAAVLVDPSSGRKMDVSTTEPGIQLYTANFLEGNITGHSGRPYKFQYGLCLECQHFPDSPNQPNFPSTILGPGKTYRQTTVHRFGVES